MSTDAEVVREVTERLLGGACSQCHGTHPLAKQTELRLGGDTQPDLCFRCWAGGRGLEA